MTKDRPKRLHFSEVSGSEANEPVTAWRYFPNKAISGPTRGVNHMAPLCESLKRLGWIESNRRTPYMYQGRKTSTVEYERGVSYLTVTSYKEGVTVWVFVKIRGFGEDVIELRDWMTQYESEYGRIRA